MSSSAVVVPTRAAATTGAPRPQPPRAQYVELKGNVHRKLLNRLNLEALANADRSRPENEIRTLADEQVPEDNTPLSLGEQAVLFGEPVDQVSGLPPLEPLLPLPT